MKGTAFDILLLVVILFSIAIFVLFSYTISLELLPAFNDTGLNVTFLHQAQTALRVFDSGMAFLVGGFMIALIVSSFYIRTHPVFFILTLLVGVVVLMVSPIISNLYGEIASHTSMQAAANEFPIMTNVFQYLPYIVLAFIVIVSIVLYSKLGGRTSA